MPPAKGAKQWLHSGAGDERKLRFAIESVLRDQEELRISTPLASLVTVAATGSGIGVASLASASAGLPLFACVLLPALTSALFVYAAYAENRSTRSSGVARYNSSQAMALASQQETILAEADARKSLIAFGVGVTAIFAAACVGIKLWIETREGKMVFVGLEEELLAFCTLSAVIGTVVTSDTYVRMRTTLTLKADEKAKDFESEWEAKRLPPEAREPEQLERAFSALAALGVSFSPLAFLATPSGEAGELLEYLATASVIISAVAGAISALVFLIAEAQFCDAERRISIQSKQAALAELFCAQATAEAAVNPVTTAASAMAFAGAAVLVEYSPWLAAILPWPGMLAAFRSFCSAQLCSAEARATRLEKTLSIQGMNDGKKRDALSSSVRELQRLVSDVFQSGDFAGEVRGSLLALPIGSTKYFDFRGTERRRQVHLMANELGMSSQSVGPPDERVVSVTNTSGRLNEQQEVDDGLLASLSEVAEDVKSEVVDLMKRGVPVESRLLLATTALGSLSSVAAASATSAAVGALVLPFATGSVALLTIWQETKGKTEVAIAKRSASDILRRLSEAEAQLGLAIIAMSAIPTYVATATFATASLCVVVSIEAGSPLKWLSVPLLLASVLSCAGCFQRQRRIRRALSAAVEAIGMKKLPELPLGGGKWWLVPLIMGLALPLDLPRRLTVASAGLVVQIGLVQALTATQFAVTNFYIARGTKVCARVETWAQAAAFSSRALPFGSAAATVNTLLAIAISGPLGVIFPILGLGICARSIQFVSEAQADTLEASREATSLQCLAATAPPWIIEISGQSESFGQPEQPPPPITAWESIAPTVPAPSIRQPAGRVWQPGRTKQRSWAGYNRRGSLGIWQTFRSAVVKTSLSLLKLFDAKGPEDKYEPNSAERAVKSVQADLDDLRISMRSSENNWLRTASVVGFSAFASIFAPYLLSGALTEGFLPVAGAALTLFAVNAENDARRCVAAAKVWSAQLAEVAGTMDELVCASKLYKARLLGMASISAAVATCGILFHWPFLPSTGQPFLKWLRIALQCALVVGQAIASAWCVEQMFCVSKWSKRALAVPELPVASPIGRFAEPAFLNREGGTKLKGWKRSACYVATLPTLLLAVFPLHRHFATRVVGATAAGAAVVGFCVLLAERACSRAERAQASRVRAHALADAFSNEAEQQGALLPLTSAASIALSALVTFGTEVNPFAASILTLFQATAWIVASRKAVKTRFECAAALEVRPVRIGLWEQQQAPGEDWQRRAKRRFLSYPK